MHSRFSLNFETKSSLNLHPNFRTRFAVQTLAELNQISQPYTTWISSMKIKVFKSNASHRSSKYKLNLIWKQRIKQKQKQIKVKQVKEDYKKFLSFLLNFGFLSSFFLIPIKSTHSFSSSLFSHVIPYSKFISFLHFKTNHPKFEN